jgi:hypothetical protein
MKAVVALLCVGWLLGPGAICRAELLAGIGRAEISEKSVPQNDPLYVKALVLKQGDEIAVLITVDAVSIGGIGHIPDTWLPEVRQTLQQTLGIPPLSVFANASHCHGVVGRDVGERTVEAVTTAWKSLQPVRAGAGIGQEVRIMENRRLQLADGSEADVRRAYSMPWDDEVTGIGPVDPEIGLLQLNRMDGTPLAVVYNFACHPIHGVPAGVSTADFPGYASAVIEETLGHGSLAFFVQGCAGDINPVIYKDVAAPHDCEPFGNMLGLNVLRGLRTITQFSDDIPLRALNHSLQLPRATDYADRIRAIEQEQLRMLSALQGTNLNFRTFVPMYIQHSLNPEYPGFYAHRYMLDERLGRNDMRKLDTENRASLDAYVENIRTMEKLTKLQTNLNLLKMHQRRTEAAGDAPLVAEVGGLRVGEFVLTTFPGEVTVQIGLNIKQASPHRLTFVAGYTNGYIWYTPTSQQRSNSGFAQEDCDSIVAPQWQPLFESKVAELLQQL